LLYRPVLEHGLTTTHPWMTAEAQRARPSGPGDEAELIRG